MAEGINFIRFVDDYLIFAESRERAHSALIRLNELLLTNEGLSLQKAKTRILTSAEFLATSDFADSPDGESTDDSKREHSGDLESTTTHILLPPPKTTRHWPRNLASSILLACWVGSLQKAELMKD